MKRKIVLAVIVFTFCTCMTSTAYGVSNGFVAESTYEGLKHEERHIFTYSIEEWNNILADSLKSDTDCEVIITDNQEALSGKELSIQDVSSSEYSYYNKVEGVPMIYQNAEGLPGGCEGTSLTMCLNYIGIPISAWDTTMNFMPHTFDSTDIENVFIGDPSQGGYGCYVGCVINTAYNIMDEYGYVGDVINHTGDLNGIYEEISKGYPVVAWGTDGWGDPEWGTYYSNTGAFEWWSNEHCLCLVGYSDTSVIIHDPYRGVVEIDKSLFEIEWNNCGARALAVH